MSFISAKTQPLTMQVNSLNTKMHMFFKSPFWLLDDILFYDIHLFIPADVYRCQ